MRAFPYNCLFFRQISDKFISSMSDKGKHRINTDNNVMLKSSKKQSGISFDTPLPVWGGLREDGDSRSGDTGEVVALPDVSDWRTSHYSNMSLTCPQSYMPTGYPCFTGPRERLEGYMEEVGDQGSEYSSMFASEIGSTLATR